MPVFPPRPTLLAVLVAVCATCAAPPADAQSRRGSAAAPFLTLGGGARSAGLGHAYTAEALGAEALFWNPAGIARPVEGPAGSVVYSHAEWLLEIDRDAAALAVPVGPGVVGLSVLRVGYGDMEVTTVDQPDGTGETFSGSDLAVGLSYAQALTDQFTIGGTAKVVRQSVWDMSSQAFAFDLGLLLQTDYLGGLRLAASIQNFGTKMQLNGVNTETIVDVYPDTEGNAPQLGRLETESFDLPLSFRFGASVPIISAGGAELRAFADANQVVDNSLNADLGAELMYSLAGTTVGLRAGYRDALLGDDVASHLSFGAGLDVPAGNTRIGFNFAYLPFEHLNDTQMFDLSIRF